jgi:hypothetical protein
LGAFFGAWVHGQVLAPQVDVSNVREKMDDSGKFGYILGFFNSSEYYQMVLRAERSGCNDETKDRITAFLEENPMSSGALGQWKSVVDQFYQDPRNKRINLVFARQIATLRMAGRPHPEIERRIERMRQLSATP